MNEPAQMPSYWSLVNEVTHLHGHCDTLEVEIADLKEENAELLETLDETEKRFISEWNRALNAERENEKLRELVRDIWDAYRCEEVAPNVAKYWYDRMRELGVDA